MYATANTRFGQVLHPLSHYLYIVPAGAIYVETSKLGIDGTALFTENYAKYLGGERIDENAFVHTSILCITNMQESIVLA